MVDIEILAENIKGMNEGIKSLIINNIQMLKKTEVIILSILKKFNKNETINEQLYSVCVSYTYRKKDTISMFNEYLLWFSFYLNKMSVTCLNKNNSEEIFEKNQEIIEEFINLRNEYYTYYNESKHFYNSLKKEIAKQQISDDYSINFSEKCIELTNNEIFLISESEKLFIENSDKEPDEDISRLKEIYRNLNNEKTYL